jgi:hypothetical protein
VFSGEDARTAGAISIASLVGQPHHSMMIEQPSKAKGKTPLKISVPISYVLRTVRIPA